MRAAAVVIVIVALAGCGGGGEPSPRLADGSTPPEVPKALSYLDGAVMTRVRVTVPGDAGDLLDGCERRTGARPTRGAVVHRALLVGQSVTFRAGSHVYACDAIPDPAPDPDRVSGDPWCASAAGRLYRGRLTDPRLALCTDRHGGVTAFAWVEPAPAARWIGLLGRDGELELYDLVAGSPVRVASTRDVEREGAASFDLVEFGAGGAKLREYTLDAVVAG